MVRSIITEVLDEVAKWLTDNKEVVREITREVSRAWNAERFNVTSKRKVRLFKDPLEVENLKDNPGTIELAAKVVSLVPTPPTPSDEDAPEPDPGPVDLSDPRTNSEFAAEQGGRVLLTSKDLEVSDLEEVRRLLQNSQKILAIKHVRMVLGVNLQDARGLVDDLQESTHTQDAFDWGRAVCVTNPHQIAKVSCKLRGIHQDVPKLLQRIQALHRDVLLPVAFYLRDSCPEERACGVLREDERRKSILVHCAATFATGHAWSNSVNKECWPFKYWITPTQIESYIVEEANLRSYFNPRTLEHDLVSAVQGVEPGKVLRPFTFTNTVSRLISQGKLVPVLRGVEGGVVGGYYSCPDHHPEAAIELSNRLSSRIDFSTLPSEVRAEAAAAPKHKNGKILRSEDYVSIAEVIEPHINWKGLQASKAEVLSDCIVSGLREGLLYLQSPPARWIDTELARYYHQVHEALRDWE
jgi:hypothetical protein